MSNSVKSKEWKLSAKYDDSDPNGKILEEDLLKTIKKATLYVQLPVSKFPRINGYITGVKMRTNIPAKLVEEIPVISISYEKLMEEEAEPEPEIKESLYQVKEVARIANNKVAKMYKSLNAGPKNLTKSISKKEAFTPWYKKNIWRKVNGILDKVPCPVCSQELISIDSFSAGHILPESKGGMICIENIIPICTDCNIQMGSRHLYWFAWHYYGKVMWGVY